MKNTQLTHYISQNCACFNIRKAARAVTQLYDNSLKPVGLRCTQFTLLVALSRRDNIAITQLAEILIMERTTLTRNLKPLEKQGLVAVLEGADRRTRAVVITKAGRNKLEQAIPYWQQAQEIISNGLGEADLTTLLSDITQLTALSKPV